MPVASPHQGRGFGDEGAPGPVQRRRPSRPATLLLAVALAASLATACSKSDSADGPTTDVTSPKSTSTTTAATTPESTTTQPATTTTAPPTPEQKVKAAFLRAKADYYDNARDPDPASASLRTTRAGPSLERAVELLEGFDADGIHVEYPLDRPPVSVVEQVRFEGAQRALVTFCVVDNGRQIRTETGEVVDDAVLSQHDVADMRFENGAWKLFAQKRIMEWKDGNGCDR